MAIFQDDAPHVAGTVITLTVLSYIAFGLRVYCRVTRRSWGIEDWLMTAATVPFLVLSIACLGASFHGIGVHKATLDLPENLKYSVQGLFWFFLFEVFYCVTIIPIKLSISFMLVRIAQNRKGYIYSQYVTMAMFVVMNTIAAFYIIFQCSPVDAAWKDSTGPNCNPSYILQDVYFATTAVNIATDWFTAFMPIPLLWNVKLNFNAKCSVAAILGLGVFASLSACIRLKYTVLLTSETEYLYGLSNIVIWGYAENGIGLFVGCVATLRPLFRRVLSLGGSDGTSKGATGGMSGHLNGPSGFPSQSRRTYKSCNDTSYELGSVSREKSGGMQTQVHSATGELSRTSMSSDSESQKRILDFTGSEQPPFSPQGIMVSRQVNITTTST